MTPYRSHGHVAYPARRPPLRFHRVPGPLLFHPLCLTSPPSSASFVSFTSIALLCPLVHCALFHRFIIGNDLLPSTHGHSSIRSPDRRPSSSWLLIHPSPLARRLPPSTRCSPPLPYYPLFNPFSSLRIPNLFTSTFFSLTRASISFHVSTFHSHPCLSPNLLSTSQRPCSSISPDSIMLPPSIPIPSSDPSSTSSSFIAPSPPASTPLMSTTTSCPPPGSASSAVRTSPPNHPPKTPSSRMETGPSTSIKSPSHHRPLALVPLACHLRQCRPS